MSENLRHWIFERYLPQNLKARSWKTHKNYREAVNDFAAFLGREPTLGDLSDETFAVFAGYLLGPTRNICERTTNEKMGRIKTFWRWAFHKRYVDTFPTICNVPVPERVPRAWREDELVKLINSCRRERGFIEDIPAWRWWITIHGWWWCTGERKEATLLLPVSALDLDNLTASVPAGIRKGRRKPAVYCLWPDLAEMLREMLPPATKPRERVFPFSAHTSTFYNRYDRMLRRAGLPHDRYCKPQKMRVSHATWRYLSGGDATRSLGHESDKTTRKHYLDPTLCKPDERQLFRPW